MKDTINLEQMKLENIYNFSLKYKGQLYKNLSIAIDNFKNQIRILWINTDYRLEKLNDFNKIQSKIFKTIVKSFKKQTKNSTLSLNI